MKIVLSTTYLCECHFGDNGEHDFLSFGWVGVLFVFVEPLFEGGCRLTGCVLSSGRQVIPASITAKNKKFQKHCTQAEICKMQFNDPYFKPICFHFETWQIYWRGGGNSIQPLGTDNEQKTKPNLHV